MKVLTAGAALFFLTLAGARVARVALTYDEAAAYRRYVATDVASVFDTNALSAFNFEVATNHFLNTVLTKMLYAVAGGGEIVLRLPNLAAYAMFMIFAALILHRFTRPWIAFAGFLLLNLNPYVLDFFTMSRGYGLSLGLVMGAVYFLFRFLASLHRSSGGPGDGGRDVSWSLVLACAAVLANFALMNVYLGIVVVLFAAFVVANRQAGDVPRGHTSDRQISRPRRAVLWLPLAATVFTLLVFSQDAGLSGTLYQPVAVSLVGLDEPDLDAVVIRHVDLRGRERPLRRSGRATWTLDHSVPFRGVRIDVPVASVGRLARIDAVIGSRPLSSVRPIFSYWSMRDAGPTRVFESTSAFSAPRSSVPGFRSVLNWAGDARYAGLLAMRTATALLVLAALAGVLRVVGVVASRARLLTPDQWRPLAAGALWLAALTGAPLYLLKRNGEIYYGGTVGLIEDTFHSVIFNSFYGKTYHPDQTQIVLVALPVTFAVFAIVLSLWYRRRTPGPLIPAACLLAVLAMASASVVAQHLLFGTVYLMGRTALFYIPLFVLFVILLCEAIAALGRAGQAAAACALAALLSASTFHFAATANMKYTWDWPQDADTKTMVADVARLAAERSPPSRVVLAVEPIYIPVAIYYAQRSTAPEVDVVVFPAAGWDFSYVEESRVGGEGTIVRTYPLSRSILSRRP